MTPPGVREQGAGLVAAPYGPDVWRASVTVEGY